jgi:hypothetical protein
MHLTKHPTASFRSKQTFWIPFSSSLILTFSQKLCDDQKYSSHNHSAEFIQHQGKDKGSSYKAISLSRNLTISNEMEMLYDLIGPVNFAFLTENFMVAH